MSKEDLPENNCVVVAAGGTEPLGGLKGTNSKKLSWIAG
jgi:hypothetical protein